MRLSGVMSGGDTRRQRREVISSDTVRNGWDMQRHGIVTRSVDVMRHGIEERGTAKAMQRAATGTQ